uniref:G-protein coupled receptors family 1 profile domain-containing protein n=1 Tax=Megaselia scalaris TaxID=36166 RepID=T1GWG3_MEGSC
MKQNGKIHKSRSYEGGSDFNALFTPLTFLVTYFNSGVNPLLYAFLSRNFRKGMKELLLCSFKKGKNSSLSSSAHHKRMPLQVNNITEKIDKNGTKPCFLLTIMKI